MRKAQAQANQPLQQSKHTLQNALQRFSPQWRLSLTRTAQSACKAEQRSSCPCLHNTSEVQISCDHTSNRSIRKYSRGKCTSE